LERLRFGLHHSFRGIAAGLLSMLAVPEMPAGGYRRSLLISEVKAVSIFFSVRLDSISLMS
jgi:hypothetical protein